MTDSKSRTKSKTVSKAKVTTSPAKRSTIDWSFLSNGSVADAYLRFARGTSTITEVKAELKNTEYSTLFNRLLKDRGAEKLRVAARSALRRRKLI